MSNINFWLTMLAAILNLLLGLLVLARNPKRPLYLSFFFFSLITSLWAFSVAAFAIFTGLFDVRLMYALGALVAPSAMVWVDFLNPETASLKRKITVLAIGAVSAAVSLGTSLVIKDISLVTLEIYPGPLLNIYGLILFALTGYLIYQVYQGMKKTSGVQRTQYQYILLGGSGFVIGCIIVNLLIPLSGKTTVTPLDAQSSLFFVVFAAVAIIRYRFMDIRMIAARSLAYFLLVGFLVFGYATGIIVLQKLFLGNVGQISTYQWMVLIFVSIVMTICFNPLRLWINKITDKIFFRNLYNPDELLNEISLLMSNTVELSDIIYKTIKTLFEQMETTNIFVAIFTEDRVVDSKSLGYKKPPTAEIGDMQKISKRGIKMFEEIEGQSELKKLFEKYQAEVSIPLKTGADTIGLIFIGEKKSGDMFSTRDLKIFEIISPEIAINVELRLKVKSTLHNLQIANAHLKELDEAKGEFMNIVSHNLRTPLTILIGYLSLILESTKNLPTEEIMENVKTARVGADRLSVLVEDIVLATSLLNKEKTFMLKRISAKPIVDDVIKKYQPDIEKKEIKIESKIQDITFLADEKSLGKIFENLIENAVKFNKNKGKILIQSKIDKIKKEIIFSVADTGVGIPKEKQSNLFDKFNRNTSLYDYNYEGVGLGLYLVQLINKAQGGHFFYESKVGEGSTFSFSLPIEADKNISLTSAEKPATI